MSETIIVVGLGEIGRPLLQLVGRHHEVLGVDIAPIESSGACSVLHICYPLEIPDFVDQTAAYIDRYKPRLTIINSTVSPGTTRSVHELTGARIVHSPVRGKHFKMLEELGHYTKFVGGFDVDSCREAAAHFESLGMKVEIVGSPETTEVAKLSETTYFGLLIAWAQEVERYCDRYSLEYDEVVAFYEEIAFLPPVKYFPGVIGGHCIMPNLDILRQGISSPILDAVVWSNATKLAAGDRTLEESAAEHRRAS